MLYLIGAGLKPEHLTLEAKQAIDSCERVFLENYTSSYSEGSIEKLEKLIEKKVFQTGRKQLEEELKQVLLVSKNNNVALLIIGNVFSATTHFQIMLEAKKLGIKVKVIPGLSIISFLGKTGLQEYKFGRIVSIPRWEENFKPTSFYDYIRTNYSNGLHTLCLLDIKQEENYFMPIKQAVKQLLAAEKDKKTKFLEKTILISLTGMGSKKENIHIGKAKEFLELELNNYPQSLIVCAKLNDKENEALEKIFG